MTHMNVLLNTLYAHLRYAAKAVVAAVIPILVALVDAVVVELNTAMQGLTTAVAGAVIVYLVKNDYSAAGTED